MMRLYCSESAKAKVSRMRGGILENTVLCRLEAVLALLVAVHLGDLLLGEFLNAELLPLLLGEPRVPALVFEFLAEQGIRQVERVEHRPVERIPGCYERVADEVVGGTVAQGDIVLVTEGVRETEGIRDWNGVPCSEFGQSVKDRDGVGDYEAVCIREKRVFQWVGIHAEILLGPSPLVSVGRIYDGIGPLRDHRDGDAGQAHVSVYTGIRSDGVDGCDGGHGDREPKSGKQTLHIYNSQS